MNSNTTNILKNTQKLQSYLVWAMHCILQGTRKYVCGLCQQAGVEPSERHGQARLVLWRNIVRLEEHLRD